MNDSMFTKKEKEQLSKIIGIDDLLDIEIAVIILNKFPDIEELFYTNFDKMIEKYGEKTDVLIKCLDIIWTEARE
ncbi:hypothetical protein [Clostridium perfringens]|uniref:hypothetical protein n=1 Tax=Clostridium perfringens TaxID=1502 RepID=UPI0024BC6EB1|nr:hypothetical protein [Clostridium perfringens]